MEQPGLLAPQAAEQGQDPWPQVAKVRFEWLTLGIRTSDSGPQADNLLGLSMSNGLA
jgi:hypothetical protein